MHTSQLNLQARTCCCQSTATFNCLLDQAMRHSTAGVTRSCVCWCTMAETAHNRYVPVGSQGNLGLKSQARTPGPLPSYVQRYQCCTCKIPLASITYSAHWCLTVQALPVQVPIPEHMDIYHLHQEAEPSDRTALQAVVDHIEAEVARLNALEEHILMEYGPEDERLQVRTLSLDSAYRLAQPPTAPCQC